MFVNEILEERKTKAKEQAAKKKMSKAMKEVLRCAPIFTNLVNSEGHSVSEAFTLYVDKLKKYRESIKEVLALSNIKSTDDAYRAAHLQGACEAISYTINLPQGYVEKLKKEKE